MTHKKTSCSVSALQTGQGPYIQGAEQNRHVYTHLLHAWNPSKTTTVVLVNLEIHAFDQESAVCCLDKHIKQSYPENVKYGLEALAQSPE
jgi:hypothetical protein